MNLSAAIPIIRIFSVAKAKEFYLDYLGFTLDWEHRFEEGFPLYAQVRRSDLVLHLSEHHGDATPGSTVFVPVVDIDALHRELEARQYAYARPGIEVLDWGRQLQVADPFGNRLRFCELAKV
ncbi:glyoxalase superfamily protein [Pseudomonas akapageensis]|uniref:glyoxalase superfamily protein n=1 Tax=Pseudomonas akapageensis TaxID=2609961 RepID=UPI0014094D21|nr:glyoxalase superfamily protein [Pseudomonas akapageensis]